MLALGKVEGSVHERTHHFEGRGIVAADCAAGDFRGRLSINKHKYFLAIGLLTLHSFCKAFLVQALEQSCQLSVGHGLGRNVGVLLQKLCFQLGNRAP